MNWNKKRRTFKNFFRFFKKMYYQIQREKAIIFRIIHIDKMGVQLRLKGKNAVFTQTLLDIVYQNTIISGLSPIDACQLGVFYGFNLNKLPAEEEKNYAPFAINNKGRYRITSQNRRGEITFIDTLTKKIKTLPLTNLVKKTAIIQHFDPTQACYIGLLAGMKIQQDPIRKPCDLKNDKNVIYLSFQ